MSLFSYTERKFQAGFMSNATGFAFAIKIKLNAKDAKDAKDAVKICRAAKVF